MQYQQMPTQGYQMPMQQSFGYSTDVQYMGHAICEDSRSAVWKESGIMMWDSRKEP